MRASLGTSFVCVVPLCSMIVKRNREYDIQYKCLRTASAMGNISGQPF